MRIFHFSSCVGGRRARRHTEARYCYRRTYMLYIRTNIIYVHLATTRVLEVYAHSSCYCNSLHVLTVNNNNNNKNNNCYSNNKYNDNISNNDIIKYSDRRGNPVAKARRRRRLADDYTNTITNCLRNIISSLPTYPRPYTYTPGRRGTDTVQNNSTNNN
jgi:hypothetical protein